MTGQPEAASARSGGAVSWGAIKAYFPHTKPATYLLALPEYGIVYVKNPKVGSSTLLVWLDGLHTGEYDTEFTNVHDEHRLPRLREVGRARMVRMLAGDAYRFSFVRNPLDRFESVYWDKMVRKRLNWRPQLSAALGLQGEPGSGAHFESFLAAVERQDPIEEMDPHWRPQHVNLMHPLVTYDHVGRVETFAADLDRICAEADLPRVPIEVRNASRLGDRESLYDGRPDLVHRVESLYATDFELYGY